MKQTTECEWCTYGQPMLWPLARPPAKERTGGARKEVEPVVHPVRLGPASTCGGNQRGLVWGSPILLRNGVVTAKVINVPGQVNQRGESQPIASGNGILGGGSVSLQRLAC
eukprot:4493478-Amphidinium_carterae.2